MTAKVMVGYPFNPNDPPMVEFTHCLYGAKLYDSVHGQHLPDTGWELAVGGNNIALQRNQIIREFLATNAEWLLFMDTDQTFPPDIIDRLLDSADVDERPIISGLVMAYRPKRAMKISPACVHMDDEGNLRAPTSIPSDRFWEVAGVGAGCLFVHRRIYEAILAENPDTAYPWFEYKTWNRIGPNGEPVVDSMGEDYVFSLRAGRHAPVLVDTNIRCGHIKLHEFTIADFWGQLSPHEIPERTYVVIPVNGKLPLTESLIKQLRAQGGYDGIIVVNNGTDKDTRRYLARNPDLIVLDGVGMGIHAMWNLGALYALNLWPRANLAILNNDLNIGPDFLDGLRLALRDRVDLVAVSPNYDGRDISELVECHQICANRYDGTGGAPGFAFMVKGELFQTGYRFPEDAMWWFGDNDLLQTILMGGGVWGITPNVTVEHIGGGGQTGDWDAYAKSPQFEIDRKAFLARWAS